MSERLYCSSSQYGKKRTKQKSKRSNLNDNDYHNLVKEYSRLERRVDREIGQRFVEGDGFQGRYNALSMNMKEIDVMALISWLKPRPRQCLKTFFISFVMETTHKI